MKIIHTKAIAVLGMILSLVTLCFLVRGLVYTIARDARYEEGAAFFAGISAILASSPGKKREMEATAETTRMTARTAIQYFVFTGRTSLRNSFDSIPK